ncbi:22819_t:CDS:2, partial [Entrophospora sp. SA101]
WICSQRRTKLTTKALGNISKLHMYYFSNIKRVNYGQNLSVDEMNSDCLTATTDMLEKLEYWNDNSIFNDNNTTVTIQESQSVLITQFIEKSI